MENDDVMNGVVVEPVVLDTPDPAPGAEEQKPNPPAADADDEKSETPEQQEQKRESRRARANARKAAELAEARTEARMLREQLEAERARSKPATVEPKREDFETLEDFHRALAKHEAKSETERLLKADREARQAQEGRSKQAQTEERVAKDWQEREASFQKQTKDYTEVVQGFIEDGEINALSDTARRAILQSEFGPQLLYKLASDTKEAERIAALPAERQAAEIGKLELKLSPAKKTTTAPAPVSGVRGASAPNGLTGNESQSEYEAKRKAQGARWAR